MARPQTKKGFVMIALDLFPAIMSAGLSTYAQTVLAEVILQCYGPAKAEIVNLQASDLHGLTGLDRGSARRALNELIEANILVHLGGISYSVNKDYESWTPKAGKLADRLDGRLSGWIASTVDRFRGQHKAEAIQPQRERSCEAIQPQPSLSIAAIQPHETPPPLEPPIEERVRSEDLREKKEDKTRPLSLVQESRPEDEPSYPNPDTTFLTLCPGGSDTTDAEARSIWSALWAQWRTPSLCHEFYEHQRWYSAAIWRASIRKVVLQAKTPRRIAYVEAIAAEFQLKGIPSELAPKHGEAGYVPASQTVQVKYYDDPWLPSEVA